MGHFLKSLVTVILMLSIGFVIHAQPNDNPAQPQKIKQNGKLNINSATLTQLTQIKGLGKVKAKAIIDYIKQNGTISSLDELTNVNGIGLRLLSQLKQRLST